MRLHEVEAAPGAGIVLLTPWAGGRFRHGDFSMREADRVMRRHVQASGRANETRAALSQARTMTTRRSRIALRGAEASGRFAVMCVRADGRERIWQRYDDRGEAEQVARLLSRIGCPSRVAGPDEIALEVAEK
jgi:hypothetical protein